MGLMDVDDAQSVEGIEEAQDKVLRFIQNIQESVEMEGDVFVFSLFQSGRGAEEEDPVFTSEIGSKDNPKELTNNIIEAAMEDVSAFLSGKHQYVVRAEDVRARCVFSLKVNQPDEDEDMDDIEEAPNKKGLLSQMMRHQERIMKVAVSSVKSVIDIQAKTIREKDERINKLEERQFETIKLTEDLMSGKHARDMEMRKYEKSEKRKDEIAGMVLQGAPMLLQYIAASGQQNGQPQQVAPPSAPAPAQMGASRMEQLVEGLLNSFTSEQFEKIASSGLFEPAQVMALVEIARDVKAKQTARDAAQAAAQVAAQVSNGVANGAVPQDNKS